ncbi:MAG: hypothetical protein A2297_06330 [Elusimicrobia bacterium RIFOXYB2_FULL_48_7]|nr:MAG: hypothetical protein A2297_06330 [Elusimicrobia bacterium RIFOXYB2_FULL_48_7]
MKSVNWSDLPSASAANSNGQYVVGIDTGDATPPSAPAAVRDGTGVDVDTVAFTTELSANWDAGTDDESGIARYWYAIGTSPGSGLGASDMKPWTDNGQATAMISVGLTLAQNATYYVSVKSENGVGLQSSTTSSNGQLVLPPSAVDTSSPVITGVTARNIAVTSATVSWVTDEPATTLVEYGPTASYGSRTTENVLLVTGHNASLAGLSANSVYHYRVISRDPAGNQGVSGDYSFTTLRSSAPVLEISKNVHAYPNPFVTGSKPVKFRLAGMAKGEVGIYTVSGRLVRKLTGGEEIEWDGRNEAGEKTNRGIYIYKITSNDGDVVTGRLVLTK